MRGGGIFPGALLRGSDEMSEQNLVEEGSFIYLFLFFCSVTNQGSECGVIT